MKNPLIKRLPRELKEELGKYLIIFLFLVATIGFVSGFLVADGSMKIAYEESFEKYKIEDGHFEVAEELPEDLITKLEEENVNIYKNFYLEEEMSSENTIRIYSERQGCDEVSLMEGKLPAQKDEIVIDRLYAENNQINISDVLTVQGETYKVSGFVAFSDYSALFKNNTDMMFDAKKFTVAMVKNEKFEELENENMHYCYAWRNQETLSEKKSGEKADDLLEILGTNAVLEDFVKQADNQAIQFTGSDMGSDKIMVTWLLYIIIVVLAFIFAVTISNTIEKEAAVIGTLRAMGYTKKELLAHYMVLPGMISVIAAIVGNILGYTCMKHTVVAMYYGSYSLPSYRTVWNGEAFILTTVIPCLLLLFINLLVLNRKLAYTPLQFLRRDLKKQGKRKVLRLRKGSFFHRFRTRIILQNKSAYLTMFVGILFANLLLMFGMMMSPLLQHYKADVLNSAISKYQYILKAPISTKIEDAEKYAVTELENGEEEEITVYGIMQDSAYLEEMELPEKKDEVLVSDGYMEKYGIKIGDKLTLSEKYTGEKYAFTVAGEYHYPPALTVFMSLENYQEFFDKQEGYFNGYFTDEKLTDVDEKWIGSIITQHDLTIIADQLEDSMGPAFALFGGFAVFIYLLVLLLLAKLVVERNGLSISMIKILGYNHREISSLYNRSTTVVVVLSQLISIPLVYFIMEKLYKAMMFEIRGWLTFYVKPVIFGEIFLLGVFVYAIATIWLNKKIKRIPMGEALKSTE